ncbi:MAG: type II toxin-antitoxin system RelE/ParE family toxin [Acidobacteria bacterium]|nr:type II toxin-antitoxin system RelE/ParE family toxin [Acidobacteriota bacterium]MCA1641080.1 type II toxin-antitoxin system RelE/ParE family toxin [Acidobacteriota bacterium]
MVFLETSAFTRRIAALLTDEEYADLQSDLIQQPDLGNVIPESGGIRKLRVAAKGHGKSGGARVIYYRVAARDCIFFLRAYAKNEQSDLTRKEIRGLRRAVEEEFG